jgi:hypothetical protein
VAAKYTGKSVTSEHCALTCSATCDNEITSTGVEKDGGENTDLNIGQPLFILCGIHTVVINLVAEGFYCRAESGLNKRVLCRLAIFIYKCNFYLLSPFLFCRKIGDNVNFILLISNFASNL